MNPSRRWLDRAAAILVVGLALLPARMAAEFVAVALGPAPGRADLWVLLFGLGAWLHFVVALVGFAIALGLWKGHILVRVVGFGTAGAIGLQTGSSAAGMLAADAVSLADEIRGQIVVAVLAMSAAAVVGLSLAISAQPAVQSLLERWASR